jgi:hypothetical protein
LPIAFAHSQAERNGGQHRRWIAHGIERDKTNTIAEPGAHLPCHLQCQAGLADATGADQGHQAGIG